VVRADAGELLDELTHFYDEPFADASAVPTYLIAKATAEHVKVVLTGDGSDELFGGYEMYRRIAPEDARRLFRPFSQVDAGLTRRHGGTGLGLYISQRLAQLLGGRIDVQSELGAGSTFTLVLPAV
jgi:light-regulated signal transduction histidine kinase (bacteriophytochrome)